MATLAHVLQLVGGWIAPLVILLVKRNSRFISFHALQVLLLQGAHFFFTIIFVGGFFILLIAGVGLHPPSAQPAPFPAVFFFLFPVIWLGIMVCWIFFLVVAIVYGIKAGKGEWAEYPLLGRLARKILSIGPGGALLS
jgi:uncharacterized membrane protein